ncbi:Uncharacterised protein (plasmid) [Mycoplasmopsis arginini]|uniref:hypothetical protein n=1 Tax=Mycoplasmopsis arginini TaxID=2094 RepID=UPI001004D93F|nr:hypothetical protein [Mycoplasmopsis arginini]VEU83369.1 Uncharacterised protein [Mycoplasmopsis arginini]
MVLIENKEGLKNENLKDKNDLCEMQIKIKELEERNSQLEMENDLLKKLRALVLQRKQQQKKEKSNCCVWIKAQISI